MLATEPKTNSLRNKQTVKKQQKVLAYKYTDGAFFMPVGNSLNETILYFPESALTVSKTLSVLESRNIYYYIYY